MVNDATRMGQYPFLSGTFVSRFDGGAYYSALELDKKLFQVALRLLAKNLIANPALNVGEMFFYFSSTDQ